MSKLNALENYLTELCEHLSHVNRNQNFCDYRRAYYSLKGERALAPWPRHLIQPIPAQNIRHCTSLPQIRRGLMATLLTMHLWGGTTFELLNVLAWVGGGAGFTIGIAYLRDVINRQAFQFERLLDREKQRSEVLLFNILPENIASRLKAKEEPLVDAHECVSILFADLSGFTEISRKLSGDELVNLLIDFFSRFDKLVKEHSAEKIKTIGDAYMVATGLSGSVADHAEKAADLALSMQEAFDVFHIYNKVDLKIRIGVHSGAVVAAGIGRKQFS